MKRIAVVITEKSDFQEELLKGLAYVEDLLRGGPVTVAVTETGSGFLPTIEEHIRKVASKKCDLLITVGIQCSISARKVLKDFPYVPHLFAAVYDPVKLGIIDSMERRKASVSGISMPRPSNLLPIQVVSRLNPQPREIYIIYRVGTHGGRIEHAIREMRGYVSKLGASSHIIALAENEKPTQQLENRLEKGAAVIVPIASVSPSDLSEIEDLCKNKKAILLASGSEVIPESAIFGYRGDVRYIGVRAAEMAADHFLNGTPLGKMPVSVLKDTTKLVFNDDRMAELGVTPPSEDLLCSFDDSLEYYDLPRHMYTVMLPWHSQLERQTALALKNCGWPPRDGMEMIPRLVDGLPYNKAFDANQRTYVLKENNTPAIVTFGRQHFYDMQATMIAAQNFKPLIGVFFENDLADGDEPALSYNGPSTSEGDKSRGWPDSAPIIRYPLPRFNPGAILPFIKGLLPNLRRVGVLHNAQPDTMPPLLQQYLREIQAACDRLGLTFIHDGAWDVDELNNKAFKMVPEIDALLTLPDFMRDDTAELLGPLCLRYKVFACSGNLKQTDTFSMVYGVRTDELAHDIDWLIRRIVMHKRLPRGDREFSNKQTFGIEVSVELSKRVGAQFTSEQALMLSWGISIAAATEKPPQEQDTFLNDLMARLPLRSTAEPSDSDDTETDIHW